MLIIYSNLQYKFCISFCGKGSSFIPNVSFFPNQKSIHIKSMSSLYLKSMFSIITLLDQLRPLSCHQGYDKSFPSDGSVGSSTLPTNPHYTLKADLSIIFAPYSEDLQYKRKAKSHTQQTLQHWLVFCSLFTVFFQRCTGYFTIFREHVSPFIVPHICSHFLLGISEKLKIKNHDKITFDILQLKQNTVKTLLIALLQCKAMLQLLVFLKFLIYAMSMPRNNLFLLY